MIRMKVVAGALAFALGAVGLVGTQVVQAAVQDTKTTVIVTPININTATAVELEKLPGVGPSMATRIVDYRQKNGGFKKIEDLMNVKGIGEKSFLKLKPQITVTPLRGAER
jgi:competence protein ComEA